MIRALSFLIVLSFTAMAAEKPNIVYILADDMGIGDLGCYGQKMLTTPNIDRLAKEGMQFDHHYAGCTVCAPSRCVLLTGLHNGHGRVRGNDPWTVPDTDLTLPKLLKQAGYSTACFGKFGLGKPLPDDDPNRKGFDEFFGYVDTSHAHNFYPTYLIHNGVREALPNVIIPNTANRAHEDTGVATKDGRKVWAPGLIGEKVQSFLDAQTTEKPFFLYYALNLPHANNEAGKKSPLGHGLESPTYGEFANKDWPDVEKGFAQFMRFIDDQVGAVMAKLKAKGMDQDTLIFFSSDNGPHHEGGHDAEFFRSHGEYRGTKRDMWDGGIHVPLLARWPGKVKAGVHTPHVCGFVDMMATVSDLTGGKLTTETDGLTFLPTLLGTGTQPQHDFLYWDFNEQGGRRAVLKWPWKLIHLNTGATGREDKKPAKAKPLEVQLFNLEKDEPEHRNVAAEHADIVAQLEVFMKQSWREP
ncbi:MAG: N-acetylgalactosamine 6-sulfatase [Verrucomicrobiaceae bacterium]|nr:N-acetylgalactosamine 6-sulfatase [Verrucomicrobiaceae bacterium]